MENPFEQRKNSITSEDYWLFSAHMLLVWLKGKQWDVKDIQTRHDAQNTLKFAARWISAN